VTAYINLFRPSAWLPVAVSTHWRAVVPKHIIVVEDDDALRYAYNRTLTAAGYTVHPFRDYRGVMEMLDEGAEAHLMLVDLVLPPGTPHGISVAAMARLRRPGLPTLYVTGHADHAAHVVAGSDVLLKPVTDETLLATVAKMMAER
jgi:DNA-binding NtrC family response regulator